MEPALIGVKSKQEQCSRYFFSARTTEPTPDLEWLLASVYIRGLMKRDPDHGNRFFRFLRRMKAGGRTNMYGAVPYLMNAFGLDRNAAFQVVCEWMDRQAEPPRQTSKPVLAGQAGRRRRTA
jgi:hypothetical protein